MEPQEGGVADPNRYYANMGVDILWTGDLAVTEDMLLPPLRSDGDGDAGYDVQELRPVRRGFERYDLTKNFVRTSVRSRPNGVGENGRLTSASVTGMWVETEHPLPFRSEVDVDWCVMGNFSMRFPGRVVRTTDTGMAVVMNVDDTSWRFRSSFIDLARTPSDEPPSVIVQPRTTGNPASALRDDAALEGLADQWNLMDGDLDDDPSHQAFISACLRAQRLEYALERYRELKVHYPESEAVTRYLKQIGTILTFYTLQRGEAETTTSWWKKGALLGMILVVVAVGSLSIAERLTAHQIETVSSSKQQLTLPPPPGARRR